ncbi:flagellar motor switch protein [Ralstonia sp. A12]|nr:flagellar motor switch protein [Ralstonia sp. A12]
MHATGETVPDAPLLSNTLDSGVNPLHRVKAQLTVCVGTATISVGELMAAREQQVLRLDSKVAQPVDLLLEGKVVARGQLVAVDDHFGVRITELPLDLKL